MHAVVAVAAHNCGPDGGPGWAWLSWSPSPGAASLRRRRTPDGSAYQRFLVASKASDVLVRLALAWVVITRRCPAAYRHRCRAHRRVGRTAGGPGGRPVLASVAAAPLDYRWGHLLEILKCSTAGCRWRVGPVDRRRPERGPRAAPATSGHAGHEGLLAVHHRARCGGAAPAAAGASRRHRRDARLGAPGHQPGQSPAIFAGTALVHQLGRGYSVSMARMCAPAGRPGRRRPPGGSPLTAGPRHRGHLCVADESTQAAAMKGRSAPSGLARALRPGPRGHRVLVLGRALPADRRGAATQPSSARAGDHPWPADGGGTLEVGMAAPPVPWPGPAWRSRRRR